MITFLRKAPRYSAKLRRNNFDRTRVRDKPTANMDLPSVLTEGQI